MLYLSSVLQVTEPSRQKAGSFTFIRVTIFTGHTKVQNLGFCCFSLKLLASTTLRWFLVSTSLEHEKILRVSRYGGQREIAI